MIITSWDALQFFLTLVTEQIFTIYLIRRQRYPDYRIRWSAVLKSGETNRIEHRAAVARDCKTGGEESHRYD